MSSKLDKSKLKSYHIILLGCLLGVLLVLNSNRVNKEKFRINQNKKEKAFFNRLISQRKLQVTPDPGALIEEEEEITETQAVCLHASNELQDYYNTSDLSKIDLDDGSIKCEDKDKDYMQALIGIVDSLIGGGDDDEDDDDDDDPINGGNGNLRNLLETETEENIKKYINRVLPLLIFTALSIISLVGWIVCCFCNCCNCCCCCCCKKPGCKIPCLIFTYIFYAAVIGVCIYGITKTSTIFTGLANTECSLLQFFDTILFGENKDTSPKWIGVEGVTRIFNGLDEQIREMSGNNLQLELDERMDNIEEQRDLFLPQLKNIYTKFYTSPEDTNPKEGFYIEYTDDDHKFIEVNSVEISLKGKYVLDLIPMFGKYDVENDNFTGLNAIWNFEISEIDQRAGGAMEEARGSFSSMLGDNLGPIEDGLALGREKLADIQKPLDNVYNKLSKTLYDVSELMNENGEFYVKLVFETLAIMNAILAVDMILICCFSGKTCVNCCCCRCLFKFSAHLIWNLLALFTVISLLIGSLIALVGRIGGDVMSFISFVMSEDNFHAENPILLNKLGEGADILEECIVGEGNLSRVFELDGITGDFDTLYDVKDEIREYKRNFTNLAQQYPAYYILIGFLNNRTEFREDTNFIRLDYSESETGVSPAFKLGDIMKLLNNSIETKNDERWNPYTGDKNFQCTDTNPGSGSARGNLIHPWICEPIYRGWVQSLNDRKISNYAKIVSDAIDILKYANKSKFHSNPDYESYVDVLTGLKENYENYLHTFVDVLDFFDTLVGNIIGTLEEGIGNSNETFSFLNGKFIKTNLKIVLKYLKYSLGKDIYTVGICLIIVGCSLIFSVSQTILLIVIMNVSLEENKKLAQDDDIPEYPEINHGRIIRYKN